MKAESLSDWASKKRSVGAQPKPTVGDTIHVHAYERRRQVAISGNFAKSEATLHPKGWRHFAAKFLISMRDCLRKPRQA